MKIAHNYFFNCPDCAGCDGRINVGQGHWFYCSLHKTRYCAGSNLFSDWKDETEEEQRTRYAKLDFGSFKDVVPLHEGAPIFDHSDLPSVISETVQYAGAIFSACLAAIERATPSDIDKVECLPGNFDAYPDSEGVRQISHILRKAVARKSAAIQVSRGITVD